VQTAPPFGFCCNQTQGAMPTLASGMIHKYRYIKRATCYAEAWREFFRFQASKLRSSSNSSVFFVHDLLPPAYVADPN
jgi:hypothetical protein